MSRWMLTLHVTMCNVFIVCLFCNMAAGGEYFDGWQWHICSLWLRQCHTSILKPTEAEYQRHWRRTPKASCDFLFISWSTTVLSVEILHHRTGVILIWVLAEVKPYVQWTVMCVGSLSLEWNVSEHHQSSNANMCVLYILVLLWVLCICGLS